MSATIRKIIVEEDIGYGTQKNAFYIKEFHTIDCTYIYERGDIESPESEIKYLFGIDDHHVDKFLSLFEARYIPDREHEFNNIYEEIEKWEYYAIRRANMSEPMTKANVLKVMKENGIKNE
jgi:hypothetical protein